MEDYKIIYHKHGIIRIDITLENKKQFINGVMHSPNLIEFLVYEYNEENEIDQESPNITIKVTPELTKAILKSQYFEYQEKEYYSIIYIPFDILLSEGERE